MPLSNELISQFVKATRDETQSKSESTHYGKIVIYDNEEYVQLDGSDILTPVTSTTMVEDGQRVIVTIKNHSAVVTGNISSPSANKTVVDKVEGKVDNAIDQITEFEIVVTDKIVANEAIIKDIVTENLRITGILEADQAIIDKLTADNVVINGSLTAANADIDNLKANKLDVSVADIKYATISSLDATNANIHNLQATYGEFVDLTTKDLTAINATIKNLDTEYANIDFANINIAAVEKLFADSGIIEDLVVSEGKITGELVGVTIKGDLIEGETIVAEKLVVRGEDGLYYKLNLDGNSVEGEQTDYNSLNGKIIAAKSITASKIAVDDLVAFDATIGGFQIDDDAIHSTIKDNINSPMSGVYMDREGQFAVGDDESYLKYYKDDNKWKLEISAQSIKMSSSKTIEETIKEDIESALKDAKENGELDGNGVKEIKSVFQTSSMSENNIIASYDSVINNGVIMATTEGGQMLISSDEGKTWGCVDALPYTCRAIAHDAGIFVAGTQYGHMYWSIDGYEWTEGTVNTNQSIGWIRAITYANGYFYSVCYTTSGKGEIWKSNDGKTWVVDYEAPVRLWVAYTVDNKVVVSGDSGAIFILNGSSWTRVTNSDLKMRQRCGCYGNGFYVTAGLSGELGYSMDTITWKKVENFTSDVLTDIIYHEGMWYAIGSTGLVFSASKPDEKWDQIYTTDGVDLSHCLVYNNRLIIIGDIILFSNDGGRTWSTRYPNTLPNNWTDTSIATSRDKRYLWSYDIVSYTNGCSSTTIPRIIGTYSEDGENATLLRIESSRGTVFKNDTVSTVLSVVLYHGGQRIDNYDAMKSVFGSGAYLQWYWQRLDDDKYGMISSSDSRFGNNGFTFTLSPEDVDTKITFMCELIT